MELYKTLNRLTARFEEAKSSYKAEKKDHTRKVLEAAQEAFIAIQAEKRAYQPKSLGERLLKPLAFLSLSIALRINLSAVKALLNKLPIELQVEEPKEDPLLKANGEIAQLREKLAKAKEQNEADLKKAEADKAAALEKAAADQAAALEKAAKKAEDNRVAELYNAKKQPTPENTPEQKAQGFARLEALSNQVLGKK